MNEQDTGTCSCCGNNKDYINRKYFYYNIACDCCNSGRHHEIIYHCLDCVPKPPEKIRVILNLQPDNE